MSRGAWGVALILAGFVTTAVVAQDAESEGNEQEAAVVREIARKYVWQFFAADLEALHGNFTDDLKETMDLEALRNMRWTVEDKLGKEVEVLDEIVEARQSYVLYVRRAKFEKYAGAMDGRWVLRDGKIAGLEFRPAP